MTVFAVLTLVYLVLTLAELIYGFHSIKNLNEQSTLSAAHLPSVSIIFSALNEEADIEAAVLALLNIDYPNFEVIAINDRSKDKTGAILNALKGRFPQLQVHHITDLPSGWFGKNHALFYGSQRAKGEWLLFTDADVLMRPDTLAKTVSYALENHLQHLTIHEQHLRNTFGLKILLLALYVIHSMVIKPWRIKYEWSHKSLGHGAFNLVNKSAYEQAGTHQAIALECLDDLKLGELIKSKGFKQDVVDGRDFVQREWYLSLPDMIKGWEKNSFAYVNYRLDILVLSTIFATLFFISPIIMVWLADDTLRWLSLANISLMLIISGYVCHQFRLAIGYAPFYPAAILLLLYTIWNSACSVYMNKGVIWRGTHYPIEQLRPRGRKG